MARVTSIERCASAGFEVVAVQNLGGYASGPLGVILARRAPGGAWTALYGSSWFHRHRYYQLRRRRRGRMCMLALEV